ncbi:MAG: hypothetical protein OQK05_00100 [Pseudopelagicola sp.]|nr:hypothetical protein [Pseudopelagicola sp.]
MAQLAIVEEAWGEDVPDWVLRLAKECEASSQNKVAAALRISAAVVSQSLRNCYAGDMEMVEDRVRGLYMSETVKCPALGVIETHRCRDWQKKAKHFVPSYSGRVRMFKTCQKCTRFKEDK